MSCETIIRQMNYALKIAFVACILSFSEISEGRGAEAVAYPLSEVQLLDAAGSKPSKWRLNQQLDSAWICSFPVQRLLHSFRTTAGAWTAYEGGYSGREQVDKLGGWESLDCDLRGHATGHLLAAYALMYANTGNEIFRLKGDSIVQGIRECQQLIGTGYVGAAPDGLLKRNLAGTAVWAPWYTIHKLMAGLLLQYRLAGNEKALDVCRDFTNWAFRFISDDNLKTFTGNTAEGPQATEEVRQRALRNEFGGIGESFYDIFDITRDVKALTCAQFFYHNEKIDPLYAADFDMGTMHANTFLPKVMAELRSYELGLSVNPHAALHRSADSAASSFANQLQMADAFWHSIVADHVLAPGCISDKEHFFDPAETSRHLTGNTGETCCTYNLLKLTRALYGHNPADPAYFDYYERALFNHILGQQDPQTGMVHYFLPLQTGAYKLYSTYDRSFWCCVGSSFESHAKYAESIYWHSPTADTVYVNLFIPSELSSEGLAIRMQTDFPASGRVDLTIDADRRVVVMVRQPAWASKAKRHTTYKSFVVKGHKSVKLNFPMTLHTQPTPDDPSRFALFYGPVLLAGQLGTEGIGTGDERSGGGLFSDPNRHNDYYGFDYRVPERLREVRLDPTRLTQTAPLEWATPEGIIVRPLYDTHRQRYVAYWNR